MEKRLDGIDIAIITALEKNGRLSFKKLAKRLSVKVNSIYYRVRILREKGILKDFTITVDPSVLGASLLRILRIRFIKFNNIIEQHQDLLAENVANYLKKGFPELSFIAICGNRQFCAIGAFWNEIHFNRFLEELKSNLFIKSVEFLEIRKVVHGQKVFNFLPGPEMVFLNKKIVRI